MYTPNKRMDSCKAPFQSEAQQATYSCNTDATPHATLSTLTST